MSCEGEAPLSWKEKAWREVDRLAGEPHAKPPTLEAVASTKQLLSHLYLLSYLHDVNLRPSRIVATAEGGISLWFLRPDGKTVVDILNHDPDVAVFATIGDDTARDVIALWMGPSSQPRTNKP